MWSQEKKGGHWVYGRKKGDRFIDIHTNNPELTINYQSLNELPSCIMGYICNKMDLDQVLAVTE